MNVLRRARIKGAGYYVPERVVTNKDLEALMDTSDEWIQQRTGIRERRFVDEETPSDLAVTAAQKALKQSGLKASDMDLLLVATLSPEHFFPGTSSFVQRKLEMGTTPALDIRGQCSGFLYALNTARAFIEAGIYERVLVIGTEVHSRALDMTTRGRDTAVLFGDGAGAVVLEPEPDVEKGIININLHADGRYAEKLWVEVPTLASSPHISAQQIEEGKCYPQMDGRTVFKHAVSRLPEVVSKSLSQLNLSTKDINLFLFHQANLRINEHVGQTLGIEPSRMHNNIDRYGNCSAASIPILLAECVEQGRLKPKDLVCMAAFGSGFTWGSAIIRW